MLQFINRFPRDGLLVLHHHSTTFWRSSCLSNAHCKGFSPKLGITTICMKTSLSTVNCAWHNTHGSGSRLQWKADTCMVHMVLVASTSFVFLLWNSKLHFANLFIFSCSQRLTRSKCFTHRCWWLTAITRKLWREVHAHTKHWQFSKALCTVWKRFCTGRT